MFYKVRCSDCFSYFLFVINFIIAVAAITLFCLGIYLINAEKDFISVSTAINFAAGIVFLICGLLTAIAVVVGQYGAWHQSGKWILVCIIFTSIIALAEIGIGIAALSDRTVDQEFREKFGERMISYQSPFDESYDLNVNKVVDIVQFSFACCGIENYEDWNNTTYGESDGIPESCFCRAASTIGADEGICSNDDQIFVHRGCSNIFVEYENLNSQIVGAVAISFASIEVLVMFIIGLLLYFMEKAEYIKVAA